MASAFALALSGVVATAGEVASKASEAETLLGEGKMAEAIDALDASVEAFWKAAPLSFRKALFVDSVTGFGEFQPRANAAFAPSSELKIYVEPVGFGWKEVTEGETVTFRTSIEIRSDKGLILAKSASPAVLEKTSRSKSRDFHITVTFDLPALKPGPYKLILTVTDEATGKSAPIELPLTIS
ncbi:hypothetical protein [Kaistia soli]|uniref:hypothetical protein n=1 Tax=Kaistia soli TaxID=446684 RepID=UPI00093445B8|nr:hypothetical protein [Kaistia soli]